MAPAAFAFCAAGADDEISAAENISAWRALRLRPRVLNDVSSVDTRCHAARQSGSCTDPCTADGTAQTVSRRRRTGNRAGRCGRRRRLCDGEPRQCDDRGCRRRAAHRAAVVSALLLAEPHRGRSLDRPRRSGGLHRAGAHRRCAGRRLEPARGARAVRALARHSQHQYARHADGADLLSSRLRRQGSVPGHLAGTGMAGEALRHAGDRQRACCAATTRHAVSTAARAPSWCPITAGGISTRR